MPAQIGGKNTVSSAGYARGMLTLPTFVHAQDSNTDTEECHAIPYRDEALCLNFDKGMTAKLSMLSKP